MEGENVVCVHNGILFSLKIEKNLPIATMQNKSDRKINTVWLHLHVESEIIKLEPDTVDKDLKSWAIWETEAGELFEPGI